MSLTDLDYYSALEVSPLADQAEVLEAYHRVADNYRKDSLASYGLLSESERQSIADFLDTALRVLSDQARRKAYDQKLIQDGVYPAEQFAGGSASRTLEPQTEPRRDTGAATVSPFRAVPSQASSHAEIPKAFVPSVFPADEPPAQDLPRRLTRNLLEVIGDRPVGGQELREMREAGGYTLEDVSSHTKVSLSNLRFIESMNTEFLPAPVYLKGSLQTYAKYLRIDPVRVVSEYMAIFDTRKNGSV